VNANQSTIPNHLLTLTEKELRIEREHIIKTRLGELCGADKPTPQQMGIAILEANSWETRWKKQQGGNLKRD